MSNRSGWATAGEEDRWGADDSETDCPGVGDSPGAAFTNLRYAVAAFEDGGTSDVPHLSTGPEDSDEMRWCGEAAARGWLSTVLDRFR